ncbi:MAG: hypothetical protein MN733_36105 [Nitrososphaera sp.]|nr:hypothetical protein [Nitrososphaera sp.]
MQNVVSPYFPQQGKRAARQADEGAGKGGWKKQKPPCNEEDRDCVNNNIIPRESGQNSIWSLITRELVKPS